MTRDVCAISRDISPACVTAYAYDGSRDFLRGHAYQQRARRKRVAIKVGRYISSDPIGIDGGLNTFLYAEASPMMYIDPEGLQVTIPLPGPTSLIPVAICILTPGCIDGIVQGAQNAAKWCQQQVNEMTRGDLGTCSCQHRDIHTSGGQSCQALREAGVCTGPYKGTGSNSTTCQKNARENAPAACRGCLAHCSFTPAQ